MSLMLLQAMITVFHISPNGHAKQILEQILEIPMNPLKKKC